MLLRKPSEYTEICSCESSENNGSITYLPLVSIKCYLDRHIADGTMSAAASEIEMYVLDKTEKAQPQGSP